MQLSSRSSFTYFLTCTAPCELEAVQWWRGRGDRQLCHQPQAAGPVVNRYLNKVQLVAIVTTRATSRRRQSQVTGLLHWCNARNQQQNEQWVLELWADDTFIITIVASSTSCHQERTLSDLLRPIPSNCIWYRVWVSRNHTKSGDVSRIRKPCKRELKTRRRHPPTTARQVEKRQYFQ